MNVRCREAGSGRTSSSTSPSFTSVIISSVISSPSSQNGSSSVVNRMEGDSLVKLSNDREAFLAAVPATEGLLPFLAVLPGVLAFPGVTFGDGFEVGVRWGFIGDDLGVVVACLGRSAGEAGILGTAGGGVLEEGLTGNESFGVDITRARGVAGTVLFTCVSDSDV